MYVSTQGFGAVRRAPLGRRAIALPRVVTRRGFAGLGQTCPNGGAWNAGLNVCCAPQGTPPQMDPCSILNNPAFIAQQNSEIAQDIATSGPQNAALISLLTSYPVNIGNDAVKCQSNPGATFVDEMGVTITCPSAQHSDVTTGGQPMSTYSVQDLAAMLNASYPQIPGRSLPGNLPFTPYTAQPNVGGAPTGGTNSGAPVAVRLVNSSGGSSSAFNVGDSWQITVTGPPNSQVVASATQNGASLGSTSMGVTNSQGQLVLAGTMGSSQVGNWVETWTVGGQSAGSISFSVAASGSTSGNGGGGSSSTTTSGGSSSGDISSVLTNPVTIGGVSIPTWGLLAAGVGALWFFGRGR